MSSLINYKSKTFWLALIFILYSLIGWLIVPIIVKDQAISNLKQLANWDTEIEQVIFNPWALSLELNGVYIQDQQNKPQIAFENFYINFSLTRSLTGDIAFDEISLSKPEVYIDIDENGQVNFQKAFTSNDQETTPAEEQTSAEAENAISLYFALIAINQGKIKLNDLSQGEMFELVVEPLSLALNDFSTNNNRGGNYSLDISLGQEQHINWEGKIGIAPFQSQGRLSLSGIKSSTFWHYAKKYSPYALSNAEFSISGDYDAEFSAQQSKLLIQQGSFGINELKLAEGQGNDSFLDMPEFAIRGIDFDLAQKSIKVAQVDLNDINFKPQRSTDGTINLLRPLSKMDANKADANGEEVKVDEGTETDSQSAENTKEEDAFTWSVAAVNVNNAQVNWQDDALETPTNIALTNINLALNNLGHDLSKRFPYRLSFTTNDKTHSINGELAPVPLQLDGELGINQLPLTLFAPYLSNELNASLDSGEFMLNSQYSLKQDTADNANNDLVGEITTQLSLNNIHLSNPLSNKPFAGFDKFEINPVTVKLSTNSPKQFIEVDQINLSKPYSNIYVDPDGVMNLASLSKAPKAADPSADQQDANMKTASEKKTDEKEQSKEPQTQNTDILVKAINIDGGRFEFTDASQKPAFSTYFDQVGGSILNLSSDINAQSKVDIQGMLETYGKLLIQGTLNPLSPNPNSNISIVVENIDMSTASTYAARYAGYQIDKGKLNLDLDYKFTGTKLKANNHIFIDKFKFGKSVKSPDATSLPLPLAVTLMKNLKGEIDIDLPISGDISDPSFSIGGILLKAFTNLITKVITSPFSLLGELVGGGDDISKVEFLALSAEIDSKQKENILKLAKALSKRPSLSLEIRGVADANIDKSGDQASDPASLLLLAKQRAQAIREHLITEGKITETRIFMLEPKLVPVSKKPAKDQAKSSVASVFSIGMH